MSIPSLKGQFLVAMPNLEGPPFHDSVIYLVGHGDDGAMGLIINQSLDDVHVSDIVDGLDIEKPDNSKVTSVQIDDQSVLRGGPVETERGFVLHSRDYFQNDDSYAVNDEIGLTATLDVLRAMAAGKGPRQSLLALGYCGWAPGQLENEIQENSWLHVPHSSEILFTVPLEKRYDKALASIGITRASLSSTHGSA